MRQPQKPSAPPAAAGSPPRSESSERDVVLGLISDTHGLLRPQAAAALAGVARILHAGDVGDPEILDRLAEIAPTTAVRGNVDHGPWAEALPETEVVEVGGAALYMLHDLGRLDLEPAAAGFAAVVYGHSHRPAVEWKRGVLYINPGAAGPRRFRLPIALARLTMRGGELEPCLLTLDEERGEFGTLQEDREGPTR